MCPIRTKQENKFVVCALKFSFLFFKYLPLDFAVTRPNKVTIDRHYFTNTVYTWHIAVLRLCISQIEPVDRSLFGVFLWLSNRRIQWLYFWFLFFFFVLVWNIHSVYRLTKFYFLLVIQIIADLMFRTFFCRCCCFFLFLIVVCFIQLFFSFTFCKRVLLWTFLKKKKYYFKMFLTPYVRLTFPLKKTIPNSIWSFSNTYVFLFLFLPFLFDNFFRKIF